MPADSIDFFHEATLRICGSLEIDVAAKDCLEYLQAYLPLDGISVHYYDEKNRLLLLLATASNIPLDVSHHAIPISLEGHQSFKNTKNTVVIYNNPEEDPVPLKIWQTLGCVDKSSLVLFVNFKGTRLGQIDFFCKGRNRYTEKHANLIAQLHNPFSIAMANCLQYREIVNIKQLLADDNRYLRQELQQASSGEIIGARSGLKNVMEAVEQVAPLNSQVLLLGETGVGKEIIANAIHYASPRKEGPLVKINCGAIPDGLIDSELFGHEKGAFTGALSQKLGRFERAHRGTIFLDEVGDLPAQAQVRLLRVLQEREIERVGGTYPIKVDVRVIAATNRQLEDLISTHRFREDLWFRLNVFPIRIPPLRERKPDIPHLVLHFIMKKSRELNLAVNPVLAPGAMEKLMAYDWPGNVRELENIVERALIRMRTGHTYRPLAFDEFPMKTPPAGPAEEEPPGAPKEAPRSLDDAMRWHIQEMLDRTGGRVQGPGGAAERLGIKPNTLRNRMRRLGIPFGRNSRGASPVA
ncbi:MAG TPA: sigma 54-interacting transcriptional regulator [Syntrophales bacterium]|nr:sigma 54-interacting transcriptional regulator [Syntrophales bacterium]